MGEWNPTIGKWYDEENYENKEPLWRELLNLASKYGDVTEIQQVILWLNSKNLHGDTVKIYTIGYALYHAGIDLKKEFPRLEPITSKIIAFAQKSSNLKEYTVRVLQEFDASDEIIAEFEESR